MFDNFQVFCLQVGRSVEVLLKRGAIFERQTGHEAGDGVGTVFKSLATFLSIRM
jgi:hypothetical protein